MKLQEESVSYMVTRALERRTAELAELERDVKPLETVRPPFPRISYTDAVAKLKALGSDIEWGQDLGGEAETLLAKQYDRPVMVLDRKSTRLNSSHLVISYAVFCLKKKKDKKY